MINKQRTPNNQHDLQISGVWGVGGGGVLSHATGRSEGPLGRKNWLYSNGHKKMDFTGI